MKTKKIFIGLALALVLLFLGLFLHNHFYASHSSGAREELLALLPQDPAAVWFVDLEEFRASPFLAQLLAWAPQLPVDDEYTQFVKATDFNYERDLDRATVSFLHQPNGNFIFGVAQGRFDQKKIEEYAARTGERLSQPDKRIPPVFALKVQGPSHTTFFTFLRSDLIAWTDDPAYMPYFAKKNAAVTDGAWSNHFARLAGSSLFAVVRQDAVTAAAMAQQSPGGFSSPQLASLVNQLDWATIGGKPEGTILRVVAEGESQNQTVVHQLKDVLSGVLLMAQVGLNGPKNRKELDPEIRQAYLDLLKSAQVDEIDRGSGKSVRMILEVTTNFLEAMRTANDKSLKKN